MVQMLEEGTGSITYVIISKNYSYSNTISNITYKNLVSRFLDGSCSSSLINFTSVPFVFESYIPVSVIVPPGPPPSAKALVKLTTTLRCIVYHVFPIKVLLHFQCMMGSCNFYGSTCIPKRLESVALAHVNCTSCIGTPFQSGFCFVEIRCDNVLWVSSQNKSICCYSA